MRVVSIGDSFSEGVGDEWPDGRVRGWADLVATGIAADIGRPIEYANLAIRGKLMASIVGEQLGPALALRPTMLTFNGGGNDMLRPRTDVARIRTLIEHVITECLAAGVQPVLVSGGDPSRALPFGRKIRRVGDELNVAAHALAGRHRVVIADLWTDPELTQAGYWSPDRIHLNADGHRRVAAGVLRALGRPVPTGWATTAPALSRRSGLRDDVAFAREHILPWVGRRLARRSSGDGRAPKDTVCRLVEPAT